MRTIFLAFFCLMTIATTSAQEVQRTDTIVPKYYVNGYFFTSRPELPSAKMSATLLKDHEGNKVFAFILDNVELPGELVKKAIPLEQVRNGQELLKQFQTMDEMIKLTHQSENSSNPNAPQQNEPFPKFRATDIDGKTWTNDDVKGKAMVVNLWYSGCGPCLREMPELSTWKEMFPEVMFFSATFHDAETTRRITDKHQFTWTHLANAKDLMAWIGNNGFPLTVVVDKTGIVRHVVHGTNEQKRKAIVECIQNCR